MPNFEHNPLIHTEQAIAHHEITPKNRNENQIRLATDLFEFITGEKVDMNDMYTRNDVMEYYGEQDFSRLYRELEGSEVFKNHPRLQGDIFKITIQDLIQYKKDGSLPE